MVTRAHKIEAATARAYLLTVARNVFLDTQRRTARHARALKEMEQAPPDSVSDPDERVELARTLKALGNLSEGERTALLLRVDHDLSYDEIAASLGISVAAAKVRVHRARLRLASARQSGEWDNEG
jgi:RNA polymerase sigma-70 factor (ECF subfamily)